MSFLECNPVILNVGAAGVEESVFSLKHPKYAPGTTRKADPSASLRFAQDDGLTAFCWNSESLNGF
jgi:hypothetical protein